MARQVVLGKIAATVNGHNTVEITASDGVTLTQDDAVLHLSAPGVAENAREISELIEDNATNKSDIALNKEAIAANSEAIANMENNKVNIDTFNAHVNDNIKHITAQERDVWNNKADGTEFNNLKSDYQDTKDAFNRHKDDTEMHTSYEEREYWNKKIDQDNLIGTDDTTVPKDDWSVYSSAKVDELLGGINTFIETKVTDLGNQKQNKIKPSINTMPSILSAIPVPPGTAEPPDNVYQGALLYGEDVNTWKWDNYIDYNGDIRPSPNYKTEISAYIPDISTLERSFSNVFYRDLFLTNRYHNSVYKYRTITKTVDRQNVSKIETVYYSLPSNGGSILPTYRVSPNNTYSGTIQKNDIWNNAYVGASFVHVDSSDENYNKRYFVNSFSQDMEYPSNTRITVQKIIWGSASNEDKWLYSAPNCFGINSHNIPITLTESTYNAYVIDQWMNEKFNILDFQRTGYGYNVPATPAERQNNSTLTSLLIHGFVRDLVIGQSLAFQSHFGMTRGDDMIAAVYNTYAEMDRIVGTNSQYENWKSIAAMNGSNAYILVLHDEMHDNDATIYQITADYDLTSHTVTYQRKYSLFIRSILTDIIGITKIADKVIFYNNDDASVLSTLMPTSTSKWPEATVGSKVMTINTYDNNNAGKITGKIYEVTSINDTSGAITLGAPTNVPSLYELITHQFDQFDTKLNNKVDLSFLISNTDIYDYGNSSDDYTRAYILYQLYKNDTWGDSVICLSNDWDSAPTETDGGMPPSNMDAFVEYDHVAGGYRIRYYHVNRIIPHGPDQTPGYDIIYDDPQELTIYPFNIYDFIKGLEDKSNKKNDLTISENISDTYYPTTKAVKDYADYKVNLTDFNAHKNNTIMHLSSEERTVLSIMTGGIIDPSHDIYIITGDDSTQVPQDTTELDANPATGSYVIVVSDIMHNSKPTRYIIESVTEGVGPSGGAPIIYTDSGVEIDIFNKFQDLYNSFFTHSNNADIHISADERTKWNNKKDDLTVSENISNDYYPTTKAVKDYVDYKTEAITPYGFRWDLSESSPDNCIQYIGKNASFIPISFPEPDTDNTDDNGWLNGPNAGGLSDGDGITIPGNGIAYSADGHRFEIYDYSCYGDGTTSPYLARYNSDDEKWYKYSLESSDKGGSSIYNAPVNPNSVMELGTIPLSDPIFYENGDKDIRYGDWGDAWFIKDIKVALIGYDGSILYEIDPNDYTKDISGNSITQYLYGGLHDRGGNVMVGIPTVWIKRVKCDNNSYNFYFSPVKLDNDYYAYAHTDKNGNVCKYKWFGAYNPAMVRESHANDGLALRSVSGLTKDDYYKNPNNVYFYGEEIGYSYTDNASSGNIYTSMESYSDRMLINLLLILISKTTDLKTIFGTGYIKGVMTTVNGGTSRDNFYDKNPSSPHKDPIANSGVMDKKGLFVKSYGDNEPVKIFGIENWWGNFARATVGSILGTVRTSGNTVIITTRYKLTPEDGGYAILSEDDIINKYKYIDKDISIDDLGRGRCYIPSDANISKYNLGSMIFVKNTNISGQYLAERNMLWDGSDYYTFNPDDGSEIDFSISLYGINIVHGRWGNNNEYRVNGPFTAIHGYNINDSSIAAMTCPITSYVEFTTPKY